MGKLNYFAINLQNPSAVYFAGQSLQGYVIVDLREEMKVKGKGLSEDNDWQDKDLKKDKYCCFERIIGWKAETS